MIDKEVVGGFVLGGFVVTVLFSIIVAAVDNSDHPCVQYDSQTGRCVEWQCKAREKVRP